MHPQFSPVISLYLTPVTYLQEYAGEIVKAVIDSVIFLSY